MVCGTKPSYYREKWARGMTEQRRLCKRCYAAAVEREWKKARQLSRVIESGSMKRVAASIGRCVVCGLDAAAWSGDGVRLCEACYRREVRRGLGAGAQGVPA